MAESKAVLMDEALANAFGFRIAKDSSGKYVLKPYKSKTAICQCDFKAEIKKNLRILDEQNAIHRYEWFSLPPGLDSELVERMLYYRGQLQMFYMESAGQFFILPYDGIEVPDVYGRYLRGTPLVFGGTNVHPTDGGKKKAFITGFSKEICYSVPDDPKEILRLIDEGSAIVRDYTPQLPERIIPRYTLMDGILDMMAECFPLARTSLISNSGVKGMRVPTPDAKDEVIEAANAVYSSAMMGSPYVPMMGTTEFQELDGGAPLRVEDYLLDLQSLDNFRLSLHGLSSGGLFQKKSHMLEGEQEMNESRAKSALLDGLNQRQRFCDVVNGIWGIGLSVEISEAAMAPQEQNMPVEEYDDGEGGDEDGGQENLQ